MQPIKHPLTVRLDDDLLRVVKQQAERTGASRGSVVADAARRTLMLDEREVDEAATRKVIDKCFNRIVTMDETRREEHELLREMLAIHVRSFYNHTPVLPKEFHAEVQASAARRFERYLDLLAENLREGKSLLDLPPEQEPSSEQSPSTTTGSDGGDEVR